MAAFGEELRREREQRGLAVETICSVTKVPARHILALEAGDFQELPGGVFRRGFVRSYLSALGLEEAPWMKRFEESCRECGVREPEETAWTRFAENVSLGRRARHPKARVRWAAIVILLLLGALSGWLAWRLAAHQRILPKPHLWRGLKSLVDNVSSR